MTVIDPFLDLGQNPGGSLRLVGRDLVMLRHDMEGALQGLIGAVGLIDPASLTPAARLQFERIAAAGDTLAGLLGAALGEDAEPKQADAGPALDVQDFAARVRRRHAGEATQKGLDLVVEADADLPAALRLDGVALHRIVDNLLGNAVKFSDTGSVRLDFVREVEGSIVLRVLDEGPGMSPEALGQAFRYGFRPADSAQAGPGVGLHIVKSLTERLGGEVSLRNRPEGGLEALLRFPADVALAERAPEAPGRFDLAGLRVLLAEDNPTNQMVASQMLRALKAEVTICGDGVEALERFELEPVDLVVVDIEMPRLSGLDVIRAIRARTDSKARVPIVALTAYAMREHRERIAAAGANGLISKPITSVEALGRGLAAYVTPRVRTASPGPAGDEADEGPVIDIATFQALCDAIGPEVMAELLEKVVADLLGAQRDLEGALETLDRDRIRSASHILISVAGALGAIRLQTCARSLNGIAHGDATARIVAEVRRCIVEIDAAVAFARRRRAAD